jgi:hypothetical protein
VNLWRVGRDGSRHEAPVEVWVAAIMDALTPEQQAQVCRNVDRMLDPAKVLGVPVSPDMLVRPRGGGLSTVERPTVVRQTITEVE